MGDAEAAYWYSLKTIAPAQVSASVELARGDRWLDSFTGRFNLSSSELGRAGAVVVEKLRHLAVHIDSKVLVCSVVKPGN